MPINFYNSNIEFRLREIKVIKKWIEKVILLHGYQVENLSIIFCSEEEIVRINSEFLKHNYPTDIITFSYSQEKSIEAELYIALSVVKCNSKIFNQTFKNELERVIIHGVLHLLGYNDKTRAQRKVMREAEDKYLKLLHENVTGI
ncbi:MAG: rRNA maturation RNase YbeY [Tenuifilaceae bacterium]|nr:rRNA maturation RNase YbeY [Bacteroidales bacterium]NLH55612.1 rRNA maturation RNase YbeY [Rikenellaceae bacterium]HNV82170.1 rRNA maturation RNase YbeY [Tenuifilaceae bacterium]HOM85518.1 rRNA maturation RNase YbeY [Tenuifilaceae bacterium]HOU63407.1 rRNA maturation RNase YbeY [Tenuifilaceae bacterium]